MLLARVSKTTDLIVPKYTIVIAMAVIAMIADHWVVVFK